MLGRYFFDSEPVSFEFDLPVEQALHNLSAGVDKPGSVNPLQRESMMGSVSSGSTYIYRSEPGSRNSFRPTFYGSITNAGGKTTLSGEITLNRIIQKFILLWCSLVAMMAVWTLLTVLANPAASWGSLIYIVVMLIACIVFFRTMIRKASPDKQWLKDQIAAAVNRSSA